MNRMIRLSVLSRILDDGPVATRITPVVVKTLRSYSGTSEESNSKQTKKYVPLSELIKCRLDEARRSFVIEGLSQKRCLELLGWCEEQGFSVSKAFYLRMENGARSLLVELKEPSYAEQIFSLTTTEGASRGICSPFLKLKNMPLNVKNKFPPQLLQTPLINEPVQVSKSNKPSDMLVNLCDQLAMTDVSLRLRFLIACQIQYILERLWHNADIYPFGGSVNGFGTLHSDLDMAVILKPTPTGVLFKARTKTFESALDQHIPYFSVLTPYLKNFSVGIGNVVPVLKARVPIIKFMHFMTNIEVDITVNCSHGILSTELFYVASLSNNYIRPLAAVLKKWIASVGLKTRNHHSVNNVSLLGLLVFFMQQSRVNGLSEVTPPLQDFLPSNSAQQKDIWLPGSVYSKLRKYSPSDVKNSCLNELLYKFFSFYSRFNFETFGISIRTGKIILNSSQCPLLIENPIDTTQNMAKNIDKETVYKLKMYFRIAADMYKRNDDIFTEELFESDVFEKKYVQLGYSQRFKTEEASVAHDSVL